MPARVATARVETSAFSIGDPVRIGTRSPVGRFRAPTYVRGKRGVVEAVVRPMAGDGKETYRRNAASPRYWVSVPMREISASYRGPAVDSLLVEVFEIWLERC